MFAQRAVDVTQACAGADRGDLARNRHRVHGRDVDDDPVARRAPGEAVPSAPRRRVLPNRTARERVSATSLAFSQSTTACGCTSSNRAANGLLIDS